MRSATDLAENGLARNSVTPESRACSTTNWSAAPDTMMKGTKRSGTSLPERIQRRNRLPSTAGMTKSERIRSTVPIPAATGSVLLSLRRSIAVAPSRSLTVSTIPKALIVDASRLRMKVLSSTTITQRRSQFSRAMSPPRPSSRLPDLARRRYLARRRPGAAPGRCLYRSAPRPARPPTRTLAPTFASSSVALGDPRAAKSDRSQTVVRDRARRAGGAELCNRVRGAGRPGQSSGSSWAASSAGRPSDTSVPAADCNRRKVMMETGMLAR